MTEPDISYQIKINESRTEIFDFSFQSEQSIPEEPPFWTELSYRQCSHCPLSLEQHKHCPVALNLYQSVKKLDKTRSIDEVELKVVSKERTVTQKTPIQHALASMLEVVYASSSCPKTQWLKPLMRFHMPLSSEEEMVFRTASMYLLSQYFIQHNHGNVQIEFSGLANIYEDMHILNTAVASRLQMATQSDSVKNAITLVDMYSTLIPLLLEDNLAELKPFFNAYLPDEAVQNEQATTNYLAEAKAFSLELSIDTDNNSIENLPAWLKEVKGLNTPAVNTMSKADELLAKSGLSLELAPLDEIKPQGKAQFTLSDEKPLGKASFTLADEPTANKASFGKAKFILPDD